MPRGNMNAGQEIGHSTRFNGTTAAAAKKKSEAAHRRNKCLRDIAQAALYGKPPLDKNQLKPVADYYGIKVEDITIADVALFKQIAEALKGDRAAFELVATYAGEKPSDKVEISAANYAALDEAFDGIAGTDGS